jgi:O-antigen ligase
VSHSQTWGSASQTLPRRVDVRSLTYWIGIAFVFAVPWENALHVSHIGRVSKVLGLAMMAVWVLSVLARGRLRRPGAFQKAYFLFLIWNGMTLYWSVDSHATSLGFRTYTEIFFLLLIFWDLFDREGAIEAALQAYVLGAFVTSSSIIVKYATAPSARFPAHERINALGYQTDGIALIVAIAAPAAWYLAVGPGWQSRSSIMRVLNFAYLPLGALGLVLTGTRGATLASIPTLIFVLWSLRRATGGKRLLAVVVLVGAVMMIGEFAPRGPLDRIGTAATVTKGSEGALGGRLGIWSESGQAFLEHPITGVGLDAHRAAVPVGKEAHNTYISVLTETGVVGFLLFGSVLVSVFARVRHRSGWEAWYWFAQLGVLAIGAMSLSLEDSKSVWIFLSLAVASAAAAESRRNSSDVGRTGLRSPRASWAEHSRGG